MEEKLDLILIRIKMLEGQLVELKQSLDAHRHEHTAMQHPGIAGQMRGGDAGMGGMGMNPGGFPLEQEVIRNNSLLVVVHTVLLVCKIKLLFRKKTEKKIQAKN